MANNSDEALAEQLEQVMHSAQFEQVIQVAQGEQGIRIARVEQDIRIARVEQVPQIARVEQGIQMPRVEQQTVHTNVIIKKSANAHTIAVTSRVRIVFGLDTMSAQFIIDMNATRTVLPRSSPVTLAVKGEGGRISGSGEQWKI